MTPYLRLDNVTKTFGKFTALKNISFSAAPSEFVSILGPSGCGKTTILRIIAGLETLTRGRVFIQGRDVSLLPVSRRNVGVVFQSYALFPNLNAFDNIAYGLRSRKMSAQAMREKVTALLDLVGLAGYEKKFPAQLSGGQQQRVALARAMALSPDLLLLDEPLSALDAKVRIMLRSEIRSLQKRLGVTAVMVTHDQEEALTMADRILVMDQGALVQDGTPFDIYDRPRTPFVASFIGAMNFIRNAEKEDAGTFRKGNIRLETEPAEDISVGQKAMIAIRPEDIIIGKNGRPVPNTVSSRVVNMEYRGPAYRLKLALPFGGERESVIESDITAEKIRRLGISENMEIPVSLPKERLRVYAGPN